MSRSLLTIALLIACCATGSSAAVRGDYKAPLLTVPFTATPPTMDGIIRDDQWQHALSINALQTTDGNLSTRQATFYLLWDEDHLYLAMRSPIRPGERMVQANRVVGRDNSKTVFDDSYEIWLNFNTTSPTGEQVFFQYLGNVAGSKYDVMFEPTVGNSRPGWESGWKPVSRITPDGKFWEMEVTIPRQSVYRNEPFADGTQIQGLFVRNFKRPWEQNSVGGSGSFSAPTRIAASSSPKPRRRFTCSASPTRTPKPSASNLPPSLPAIKRSRGNSKVMAALKNPASSI